MSGGHFDNVQHAMRQADMMLTDLIMDGCGFNARYTPETIHQFMHAQEMLKKATAMLDRVDWLVSNDDSEETFHQRWGEEWL